MDNSEKVTNMSNIDTGTAGVLALLADTNRAGRGNGFWGGGEGGYGGASPWATPGAIRSDILANRDIGNTGIENLQREFSSITTRDLINGGFNRICDTIAAEGRRSDDKFAALTDKQHDADIRNVQQFCDLKAGHEAIKVQIDANQKFNELFAENQALKTQVACGCVSGCSTPCNSHHHGRG